MACEQPDSKSQESSNTVVIKEAFHTDRDEGDNVDSPAVWHGPDGQHWLLATAKEGDTIIAFDATDGSLIKRFGGSGAGAGQLERPNGIAVIDDLVLVVERDNRRIQLFSLPEFESQGSMTHEDLRLPYGLTVFQNDQQQYELYVTDNYNPALEGYPPQGELDERVHHFRFSLTGDSLQAEHMNLFGDITGEGVLHKVESIFADPVHNRLLIADEAFDQRSVKVYDLEGNFTGEVISDLYFTSEPEGIALYTCEDGSGYWIMTDQHESPENKFQVFERQSLDYIGTFKGEITRNTDGIWLTQQSFGDFPQGAFYPVHDDGSVTAIDWQQVASQLGLSYCD
ncbi:phytase [Halalkalibaculum sp. DA3122]|uniref:phytase n=1 Tax=Halalkalibaculum sp. DA3122 TaxID=3373607 RepID=UPI003754A582